MGVILWLSHPPPKKLGTPVKLSYIPDELISKSTCSPQIYHPYHLSPFTLTTLSLVRRDTSSKSKNIIIITTAPISTIVSRMGIRNLWDMINYFRWCILNCLFFLFFLLVCIFPPMLILYEFRECLELGSLTLRPVNRIT